MKQHPLGFPFALLDELKLAMELSKITGRFAVTCSADGIHDIIHVVWTPAGPLARGGMIENQTAIVRPDPSLTLESKIPVKSAKSAAGLDAVVNQIVKDFIRKWASMLPVVKE